MNNTPKTWRNAFKVSDWEGSQRVHRYSPTGYFVLRTPLLPINKALLASDVPLSAAEKVAIDKEGYDASLSAEISAQHALLTQPLVSEAIYIASPSLFSRVSSTKNHDRKTVIALHKYLTRMSWRSTPFGLCATTFVGKLADSTHLASYRDANLKRHVRVDMSVPYAVAQYLSAQPRLFPQFRLRTNNSLYRIGQIARYVEVHYGDHGRSHVLSEFQMSEYTEFCIDEALLGINYSDLVARFTTKYSDIPTVDITAFIDELIQTQVLCPQLEPTLTCQDPLKLLLQDAERITDSEAESIAAVLFTASNRLDQLQTYKAASLVDDYREIEEILTQLPIKMNAGQVLQVDAYRESDAVTISETLAERIGAAVEPLFLLTANEPDVQLSKFKARFLERYGTREVPLCEVLDPDFGLGFGSLGHEHLELADGIAFRWEAKSKSDRPKLTATDAFLLPRIGAALGKNAFQLTLTVEDLNELKKAATLSLPEKCAALVVTCTTDAQDSGSVDHGCIYIKNVVCPTGNELFGRFCNGHDFLRTQVAESTSAECADDCSVIFAEIVHVPEGRVANVIQRPQFRIHEIPYLGRASATPENEILVSDMLVSVSSGRLILRSKSRNCRVVPRLTCAHYFRGKGLSTYQFLCSLQHEFEQVLSFRWGSIFDDFSFLPRIQYGSLVLGLARWRISPKEIAVLRSASQAGEWEAFREIQKIRDQRGLPRYISVNRGDNVLVIDLDSPLSIISLTSMLSNKEVLYIHEVFQHPRNACVGTDSEKWASEIIVPLKWRRENKPNTFGERQLSTPNFCSGERTIFPGGSWAFFKIYASANAIDTFLALELQQILSSENWKMSWFFIRYGDPDWHLRLRIRADLPTFWDKIAPALLKLLSAEQYNFSRTQMDTYDREIERYGGSKTIDLCEALFCHDSIAVTGALRLLRNATGNVLERWKVAVLSANSFAQLFFKEAVETRDFFYELFASFVNEFGDHRSLKVRLSELYRRHRLSLEMAISGVFEETEASKGIEALFAERNSLSQPLVNLIMRSHDKVVTKQIASSCIHMNMNRLFRVEARREELVVYYLLARAYESIVAKS